MPLHSPRTLHFILCALFALTLSACGGSGSDGVRSSLQGQIDTLTTDLEAAKADLDTARADVMRLTALVGTDADADSLRGQLAAAQLRVRELESQARTASNEITSLRRQLDDARTDVTEAEQRATEAGEEADRRVEQVYVTLRAPQLLTALDLVAADEITATVRWRRRGSLTFTPTGSWAPGAGAPSISGWRSAAFSRERGAAGTETVYLYTDIQPAGTKAFWKVYGNSVDWSVADTRARPNPSALPSPGTSLLDPDGDGEDIPESERPGSRRLSGTYDGVSGHFECEGTGCDIDRAANGTLSLTETWRFSTSASGLTQGLPQDQDTEYLYFGMWLYEPDAVTAAYEFKWIAGGGETLSESQYDDLTGTATFDGPAVGKYALINQAGQENLPARSPPGLLSSLISMPMRLTDGLSTSGKAIRRWPVGMPISARTPHPLRRLTTQVRPARS